MFTGRSEEPGSSSFSTREWFYPRHRVFLLLSAKRSQSGSSRAWNLENGKPHVGIIDREALLREADPARARNSNQAVSFQAERSIPAGKISNN